MKAYLLLGLLLGATDGYKLRWQVNDSVKPEGEAHVEPPG